MRMNRITLLLACLLATSPCLADSSEVSLPGHDAKGSLLADSTAFVPVSVSGIAGGDAIPGTALFGNEMQPAAPVAASNEASRPSEPGIGIPVDAAELDQLRGGQSTVDNDVLMDGAVEGNTADRIVSGANAISDGAFTNANGINTVIQNTGSNVLIQNGMVVNVQFVAPTP